MTLLERFDVLCPPDTYIGNMSCNEIRRALAIAERVQARAADKRLLTSRVVAEQIIKEADELLKGRK